MKRVRQLVNLAARTFGAFFPATLEPDDAFAESRLSAAEYALYAAMDVRDRHHACRVARAVLAGVPAASDTLVRAALLHDVGKSGAHYRAWERILVHLYTPRNLPREPRLSGLRGAWQRRLHHDHYGAELIRRAGGDAEVADIVARHHRPAGHAEAEQLKNVEEAF